MDFKNQEVIDCQLLQGDKLQLNRSSRRNPLSSKSAGIPIFRGFHPNYPDLFSVEIRSKEARENASPDESLRKQYWWTGAITILDWRDKIADTKKPTTSTFMSKWEYSQSCAFDY